MQLVGHTNTRFVHYVYCLVKCMCKELFRQDILGFGLGASIWAVGKDVLCISFQKRAYSNE
jgi:hypothetical protein